MKAKCISTKKSQGKVTLLSRRLMHLVEELATYDEGTDIRIMLQQINEIQTTSRRLGVAIIENYGITSKGGKGRVREYFLKRKQEVIQGYELAVVAGVPTYGRRIRELREDGMKIFSGSSGHGRKAHGLGTDQYLYTEE